MSGRTKLVATVLLAFAGAIVVALLVSDGSDVSSTSPTVSSVSRTLTVTETEPSATASPPPKQPPVKKAEAKAAGPNQGKQAQQEGPSGPAPSTDPEKEASAAVDAFLAALDHRDGNAICSAFADGALDRIEFPRPGGSCTDDVSRSLGYRDPRGLPIWRSSKPTGDVSASVTDDQARVTATVLTRYRGQREPSVEDDVVYLRRVGNTWLIVKPSATFYRAIGVADVPLDAFRPPD